MNQYSENEKLRILCFIEKRLLKNGKRNLKTPVANK